MSHRVLVFTQSALQTQKVTVQRWQQAVTCPRWETSKRLLRTSSSPVCACDPVCLHPPRLWPPRLSSPWKRRHQSLFEDYSSQEHEITPGKAASFIRWSLNVSGWTLPPWNVASWFSRGVAPTFRPSGERHADLHRGEGEPVLLDYVRNWDESISGWLLSK